MPKVTSLEVEKLMERMYRLWNIRPRSEKEVIDYLKRLSISTLMVDTIVARLKQLRLLNDEEFAKSWVEARSKRKGIKAIRGELYKKGISKQIIEEVINEQSMSRQEQVAENLLQKRWPRWKNLVGIKKKQKAYEFLFRRGFEYEIIKDLVEKYIKKGYN